MSIQCQQQSPIWNTVKKETSLSAEQLNCATAVRQPWGLAFLWLDSSALFLVALHCPGLLCAVLVCSVLYLSALVRWYFSSAGETVFNLLWKEKVCSQSQRRAGLSGQKFPLLVPNWSVLMEVRTPNPHKKIFFNEVRSLNYFNTKRLGRTIALSVSTAFIALFLRVGDIKLARNSIFDNNE